MTDKIEQIADEVVGWVDLYKNNTIKRPHFIKLLRGIAQEIASLDKPEYIFKMTGEPLPERYISQPIELEDCLLSYDEIAEPLSKLPVLFGGRQYGKQLQQFRAVAFAQLNSPKLAQYIQNKIQEAKGGD